MIKGTRIETYNLSAVTGYGNTFAFAHPLLTLPTGKTFVLTDLVVGFSPSHVMSDVAVTPGIALTDVAEAGGTAGTAGEFVFTIKAPTKILIGTAGSSTGMPKDIQPLVLTDIQNGPEFSTCLSVVNIGTWGVPTFGVHAYGYLR